MSLDPALGDLLAGRGELLPLRCADGEYYAFNITCVIDALDYERAEVQRFRSSGRVMEILRYAFHLELLRDATIFKLPEMLRSRPFVTEVFVERIKESGLLGFEVREVWPGENGRPGPWTALNPPSE